MKISRVSEDDLPQLAQLYQQLIPNEVSIPNMKMVLECNLNNPNHVVLVAKINEKVVGTLLAVICNMLFSKCKSFMVVEDVVVDEAYRKNGVGRELMSYIEETARNGDCSYIMLITDNDRHEANEFYKSLGYSSHEYRAFKKHL